MFDDAYDVGYTTDGNIYVNVRLCQIILNKYEFNEFSKYLDSIYMDEKNINDGFNNISIVWGNIYSEVNHGFIEIYNNFKLFKENIKKGELDV